MNAELWYLCSQSGKGTLFAAMPRSAIVLYPQEYPEAMLLTLWSWSGSWPLFLEQVFVSLTCMRGEQRKLWLGLCKLEKEKGEISEEGGKKLNPPTLTAQIFLELFVFSLSSVRMEKRLQLREELRVSRHFIPAELMMLF